MQTPPPLPSSNMNAEWAVVISHLMIKKSKPEQQSNGNNDCN